MNWSFYPHRTRSALDAIAKAFPLNRDGADLDQLFAMLDTADWAAIPALSQALDRGELDLLGRRYRDCTATRALASLALILGYRGEGRSAGVWRWWLHHLPASDLLDAARRYWREWDLARLLAAEDAWVAACLDGDEPVMTTLIPMVRERKITVPRLRARVNAATPLLAALTDFLFDEGGDPLRQLDANEAARAAAVYLARGEDERVWRYLHDYPEQSWKAEFLDRLIEVKGPPDPARSAFYGDMDAGKLWAIRTQLFLPRLLTARLPGEKEHFWQEYLHHITLLSVRGQLVHLVIGPFTIEDSGDETRIRLAGQADAPVETVPWDHRWRAALAGILSERLHRR